MESISEDSQKLSYVPGFYIANLLGRTMEKLQVLGEFIRSIETLLYTSAHPYGLSWIFVYHCQLV